VVLEVSSKYSVASNGVKCTKYKQLMVEWSNLE
jgi:hypothetical protein